MTRIHKDKTIGYRPPPDVRKILESIPKGQRSEAISKAIRIVLGKEKENDKND